MPTGSSLSTALSMAVSKSGTFSAVSMKALRHLRTGGGAAVRRHLGKRFFRIAVWIWIAAYRLRKFVVELTENELRVAREAYDSHNAAAKLAHTRQALSSLGFLTTDEETRRLAKQNPIPFSEFTLVLRARKREYVYHLRDLKRGKIKPRPTEICELFEVAGGRGIVSGNAIADALRTFGVSPAALFIADVNKASYPSTTSPPRDLSFAELNAVVEQKSSTVGEERLSPAALFPELDVPDVDTLKGLRVDSLRGPVKVAKPTRGSALLSSDDDSSFDFGGFSSPPPKQHTSQHAAGPVVIRSGMKPFFRRGPPVKSASPGGSATEPKRRLASIARGLVASGGRSDIMGSKSEANLFDGPDWTPEALEDDTPKHSGAKSAFHLSTTSFISPKKSPRVDGREKRSLSIVETTLPIMPPRRDTTAAAASPSPPPASAEVQVADTPLVIFDQDDADEAAAKSRPWSRELALAEFRGRTPTALRPISREAERAFVDRMAIDVATRQAHLEQLRANHRVKRHFSVSGGAMAPHSCLSPIAKAAAASPPLSASADLGATTTTRLSTPTSRAQRAAEIAQVVAPRPTFDTRWVPPPPPSKRSQLAGVSTASASSSRPASSAAQYDRSGGVLTVERHASALLLMEGRPHLSTWLQGGNYLAKGAAPVPRLSRASHAILKSAADASGAAP